jgi:hypothetical protein
VEDQSPSKLGDIGEEVMLADASASASSRWEQRREPSGWAGIQKVFEDSFCRATAKAARSCRRKEALASLYAMFSRGVLPTAQGWLYGRKER